MVEVCGSIPHGPTNITPRFNQFTQHKKTCRLIIGDQVLSWSLPRLNDFVLIQILGWGGSGHPKQHNYLPRDIITLRSTWPVATPPMKPPSTGKTTPLTMLARLLLSRIRPPACSSGVE